MVRYHDKPPSNIQVAASNNPQSKLETGISLLLPKLLLNTPANEGSLVMQPLAYSFEVHQSTSYPQVISQISSLGQETYFPLPNEASSFVHADDFEEGTHQTSLGTPIVVPFMDRMWYNPCEQESSSLLEYHKDLHVITRSV